MTEYNDQSTMIYKLLGTGKENAMPCDELARIYDTYRRDIIKQVHTEREKGFPICTSDGGYFRPKNAQEIKATLRSLTKRTNSTINIIKVFKKALSDFDSSYEQLSLEEFIDMNS